MSSIHMSDTLYVYDGTDTNAPLIGAYNNFTNPVLSLLPVQATLNNPSGCLTVRFVSGSTNEADGFHALISCEHQCQEVIAALNLNETFPTPDTNYIAICPGTEIQFAADALFAQNDILYHQSEGTSTFEWVFGDGTSANGPNVSHIYDGVGGYTVSLFVTDAEGCTSSNSIETRVAIAGNPFSNSNPPDPICANDTLALAFDMVGINGTVVEGTPFFEEITTTLGVSDTTYLPDGTGVCYETSVIFNCFEPGQTLDNPQDFLNLAVNMEHSFLGDLEISIICPNDQVLVLKSFTDDGGATGYGSGTQVGEPEPSDDEIPGTGWNYSWTPINPTYSNMGAEGATMGTLEEGSYTPYGTFYDLVGCPLNGEWTIEICDNWGADNGYIFSWEMSLNPDIAPDSWSYTVPIEQYAWTSGPYIISQTDEAISVSPPISGFFDYNYNIIDHYGCSWDTLITLEVLPSPAVNLGQDLTFCPGTNSHTFNAMSPGNNYVWQDGSTGPSFTAIVPGDYSITVSNALCSDIDSVSIYPHSGFTTMSSSTDVTCNGANDGTGNVQANSMYPPYFFHWSDGQIGENANELGVGTYQVTIYDNAGCETFESITIDEPSIVEASLSSTLVSCFGGFDGSIELTVNGGVPPYTYLWSNGLTVQNPNNLNAGDYQVSIMDKHNCLLSKDIIINQANPIATNLPSDHFYCSEFSETLSTSVTGGNAPYQYLWSTGENSETIQISPSTASQYKVTVTDSKDCMITDLVHISVHPELELFFSTQDEKVCPGESTILNIDLKGGTGSNYSVFLNGSLTNFPVIVYPQDQQHFHVIAQDLCFNEAKQSLTLYHNPVPAPLIKTNLLEGCTPLTVQFSETNSNNSQYLWEFTNGLNLENTAVKKEPSYTFNHTGVYDVSLRVINEFGCEANLTNHRMIYAYPSPKALFESNIEVTSIINPQIKFFNKSEEAATYLWNFGDGETSDIASPTYSYNSIGDYHCSLTVTSNKGCTDTKSMLLKVNEEFTFYAPDAFTPDQDYKNETFKVFGNGIDPSQFSLQVYDRWGMKIFESDDLNEGWNGTLNNSGSETPVGSYRWVCIYKNTNGNKNKKTGTVALIK